MCPSYRERRGMRMNMATLLTMMMTTHTKFRSAPVSTPAWGRKKCLPLTRAMRHVAISSSTKETVQVPSCRQLRPLSVISMFSQTMSLGWHAFSTLSGYRLRKGGQELCLWANSAPAPLLTSATVSLQLLSSMKVTKACPQHSTLLLLNLSSSLCTCCSSSALAAWFSLARGKSRSACDCLSNSRISSSVVSFRSRRRARSAYPL
mmetsp:Transcript_11014/g.25790  ORF Transcript_11014/g.25790 Transcript_11014/m.25790 type:complete len:205 (-) Transcript_11014:715-1329(-)